MTLLLDTHVFLWWLADDRRLKAEARAAIADKGSVVHVSAATCWEIAIKRSLGRLLISRADIESEIPGNGFVELPISARHAIRAGGLPRHHEDPFDRMLVAQALVEGLVLVTHDMRFADYGVSVLPT